MVSIPFLLPPIATLLVLSVAMDPHMASSTPVTLLHTLPMKSSIPFPGTYMALLIATNLLHTIPIGMVLCIILLHVPPSRMALPITRILLPLPLFRNTPSTTLVAPNASPLPCILDLPLTRTFSPNTVL